MAYEQAKGLLIALRELGIQIDRLDEAGNGLVFLFTVPKSSTQRDANGEEMSGKHLASIVKYRLEKMGMVFSDIRYHIRDEHWDDEKRATAREEAYRDVGYKGGTRR